MTFARDQKEVKEESKEICEVRFPGRRKGRCKGCETAQGPGSGWSSVNKRESRSER